MADSSRSRKSKKKKWYENQALIIAILGVIAALISVSPQIIGAFQKPEPTPTVIPRTATMEPSPALSPTPTETVIPFTATFSPTPTETGTPTPITPPLGCLDRWQVISSNPDLAETTSQGDCKQASVPALGISTSRDGISFGINSFREQGNFGIATSLPTDVTVTLQVDLRVLTQGEFWIALSNTPDPENNMFILAVQPNSGELRLYSDQTSRFSNKYNYSDLLTSTTLSSGPPFSYKITFAISGNSVNPQIHFTDLPAQIVNLPKYLFIGYNNKSTLGSVSLQAEIGDLSVR